MYLKRLELHGFKSFASTTTFEFGPGVTCVIGPNGAGKTNVADAIRWVLGEQHSRLIRARKTEDVIFSGSAKRQPLGFAEVRIALDNSDTWLPLDFAEVVVSRRAYRSGENEYYLNQSRVRLRDIAELFLKAQVGQNSYAFMGQGLVEEVLTLRPEDRRGLIEEAADVRLHRTRLDEARHRLAGTRDNLERIALLVREIEPRLRQLERQADRAKSHERLSVELAQTLKVLFGEQWQQAQEALAAARAGCDQRQEEFEAARRDVTACDEGLASLTTAIEERRSELTARVEALRSIEDYRRDLQRRVTIDDERQQMLASRSEELAGELEALQREREQLASLVAEQEERANALVEQLAAARLPEEQARELEATEARLAELREQLSGCDAKAAQAQAVLGESGSRIAALDQQRERLESDLSTSLSARREQIAQLKAWAQECALRRHRHLQLAAALEQAQRSLVEAEPRLNAASANVARVQEELRSLSVEVEAKQARLEIAQGIDAELPAPDEGVKAIFGAGGLMPGTEPLADSRIHGLVGMVGQLIRVPAGLERAIEAALAEHVHAVVVESQEDALAAVELLISEDLGRATIFPLGDVRTSPPINLLEERGVVGVAADLVRCEARYRPLINALLGRTIVAQNLGVAKMLLRRGLGSVVTLDGTLVRPVGSLTAGSAKAVRRAFAHQRDVGELPKELEQLRSRQQDAEATLDAAQRELLAAQQAHQPLPAQVERARADFAAAEAALRQHRGRLAGQAARLSAIHARRGEMERALREAQDALDAARRDADRARATQEELTVTRSRLQAELEDTAAAHEQLRQATADRVSRLSALEAEQEAFSRLQESQAGTLARLEQELAHRQEQTTRLEEELTTVRARLETTRRELEEKSQEAAAAGEALEPARHELAQLESRQRSLTEELTSGRSRALAAERAALDAEAAVRLRGEELEALRERLEEEGFRTSEEGEVVPTGNGEVVSSGNGDQPPAWLAADPTTSGEGLPPVRGGAPVDVVALKDRVAGLRAEIRSLGPVNEQASTDYSENRERYDFLSGQLTDLRDAEASLQEAIEELERIIKERFSSTFHEVNREFRRYFEMFFGGGHAELVLTKPDENGLPGVDITAQPPRKRVRTIHMLSGGERSLTAVALLFALLQTHPSPICVLDEVDAALDEANVGRFTAALRELAERTQFIIITHNRQTIEIADTIYGVSMGEDSTSAVLSLRLGDIPAN